MGAWGTGIFQDDLACDIRDGYVELLGEGLSAEAAKARILAANASSFADPDESGVAWLALAAAQFKAGRLDQDSLGRALHVIESGQDLKRWNENPSELKKRRASLERLREQLLSTQPTERKVRKRVKCECPWGVGDMFTWRLLSGKLIILRVIGHHDDHGGKYPVCELLDWLGDEIPPVQTVKGLTPKRSRPDRKRTIYKVMPVGLNGKWLKRTKNLDLNLSPFYKHVLSVIPGTRIQFEREPSSIIHFKFFDAFLKEWFLID